MKTRTKGILKRVFLSFAILIVCAFIGVYFYLRNIWIPNIWPPSKPFSKNIVYYPKEVERVDLNNANINISYEGVDSLLACFDKNKVTEVDLERLVNLPVYQLMIEHHSSYMNISNKILNKNIQKTLSKNPIHVIWRWIYPLSYNEFGNILREKKQYRIFVDEIKKNEKNIKDRIFSNLNQYLPKDLKFSTNVLLCLGGGSSGFAIGPNIGLALDWFKGDFEGFLLNLTHEVFHNAYRSLEIEFSGTPEDSEFYSVLWYIQNEGMATYIELQCAEQVDPEHYGIWCKSRIPMNRRKLTNMDQHFRLLPMLFRSIYVTKDAEEYRRLKRRGMYHPTKHFYFIGYQIAQTIDKELGKTVVEGPINFFATYIGIYHNKSKSEIPPIYRFSEQIENKIFDMEKSLIKK